MRPQRIQRRRSKGWRKPAGAVSVTRPGKWGNPFAPARIGDADAHREAVERFRRYLDSRPDLVAEARQALRGRDLMCFCSLNLPCHADAWIEVVNA